MVSFPPGSPRKGTYGPALHAPQVWPQFGSWQVSKAVAVLKGLVAARTGHHGEPLAWQRQAAGLVMQKQIYAAKSELDYYRYRVAGR
jgi:hypothetical protein